MLFDDLDYVPSSDPIGIFHNGRLGTNMSSPSISVVFHHISSAYNDVVSTIDLRAASNQGGVGVWISGGDAVRPYIQRDIPISAYIPGLAGLLEKEGITSNADIKRKSASGQSSVVMRNILLNLKSDEYYSDRKSNGPRSRLDDLNEVIQNIYPNLEIVVDFDNEHALHISAFIGNRSEMQQPLESAATGILQIIQIFSYLIRFRPKITLIEEPDSHLHPDIQRNLIETLELASREFGTQIILTTHSPHIVREAGPDCKIIWMEKGEVKTDDGNSVRRLLGWGGLSKSVFLFTEDREDKAIRAILKQWPDLYRQICVYPCSGLQKLPNDDLLNSMQKDDTIDVKFILHRDRDFMNDDEATQWTEKFSTTGVFPWITSGSDIESYFCSADYLSSLYDIGIDEAEQWVKEALTRFNENDVEEKFFQKRREIRGVSNEKDVERRSYQIWTKHGVSMHTVVGKKLHGVLKNIVDENGFNSKELNSFLIPGNYKVAVELESIIRKAIDFRYR